MKIAIIISSFYSPGGEERVVSIMANEWSKENHVKIFTFENREWEKARNDYYVSENVSVERVSGPKRNLMRRALHVFDCYFGPLPRFVIDWLRYPQKYIDSWVERINAENFDVVIAISAEQTMLLGRIAPRIKSKAIAWEHSSYEGFFDKKTGYLRGRAKEFIECAGTLDNIIVLNKDIADKYQSNLGLNTTIIENPKSFSSEKKITNDAKRFISCGRLAKEKAYEDMIEALSITRKNGCDWDLMIVGGGELKNSLEKRAVELGVSEYVSITGYVSDVDEKLLTGGIFLLTSRWEGFPMVVTEALEVGLPIIAYDIPAMLPLVTDGVEGYLVEAADVKKLAETMRILAGQSEMRINMSKKAIEKASLLEPEIICKKWKRILE